MKSGHIFRLACKTVLTLLFLCPFKLLAANTWSYQQKSDPQTNLSYSFAQSPVSARGAYDNLRLEVTCKDNILQVSVDADNLIASQGSDFNFEYQIDKNPPVSIQMKTFPDSKRKGYTEKDARRIIDGMLAGQSVFIRIDTMIRKVLSAAIPLDDAAESVKHVVSDCGLGVSSGNAAAESSYSLAEFEQDLDKLPPDQQRQVLNQLKEIVKETQKALLIKK
ncbi:MAG: hypothetical protein ACXWFI_07685 [Methylobacter sp.]